MAQPREAPTYAVPTHVKPERRTDFETFLAQVVAPAMAKARPDLADQWQVLRPRADSSEADFMFLFYGGSSIEDWYLEPVFKAAFGDSEGQRRLAEFMDFQLEEQDLYEFSGEVAVPRS